MPLTLELEAALEQRLRWEAQQQGLPLEAWLAKDLEHRFQKATSERVLLQQVTQGLPESFWVRYKALIAKRRTETLTELEQAELIGLSDQAEELTVMRTQALLELAKRRQVTIEALRVQYGLHPVSLEA